MRRPTKEETEAAIAEIEAVQAARREREGAADDLAILRERVETAYRNRWWPVEASEIAFELLALLEKSTMAVADTPDDPRQRTGYIG